MTLSFFTYYSINTLLVLNLSIIDCTESLDAGKLFKILIEPMYETLLRVESLHVMVIALWRLTNGRIKIGIKTLCAILSHFEKEKLIESVETTDRKKLLV